MQKRALLSVSDKTGLVDFAQSLTALGWQIISTGGTAGALSAASIPVVTIEEITAFPECFGGRVKTMHPKIMGGILFKRDDGEQVAEAKKLGIDPIDLVVVNLYPFAKTKDDPKKTREDCIEQIDIGGPTLLRSAAKNHEHVTVVCDPADYGRVIAELEKGDVTEGTRRELSAKAFLRTAAYGVLITEFLSGGKNAGVLLTNGRELRYGENPHQWGKFFASYTEEDARSSGWGTLHQGKALSYLNILDADGAWNAVCEFTEPAAVFVKHANPSGIAMHENLAEAFQRAYDCDRLSAFGVIIALNRACATEIAQKILDQKMFVEVVVAPSYEPAAMKVFERKPNIRVIEQRNGERLHLAITYRSVLGGMIVQDRDNRIVREKDLTVVTKKKPTPAEVRDLLFAWKCVKHAKSNAIVFAHDCVTIGIGSGQTSRVDATWIAAKRAGEKAKGAVMASDAFFPFPDSVEEAAHHGIAAIIQPGGSVRDQEVYAKADELGIAMVTTGVRAFRH